MLCSSILSTARRPLLCTRRLAITRRLPASTTRRPSTPTTRFVSVVYLPAHFVHSRNSHRICESPPPFAPCQTSSSFAFASSFLVYGRCTFFAWIMKLQMIFTFLCSQLFCDSRIWRTGCQTDTQTVSAHFQFAAHDIAHSDVIVQFAVVYGPNRMCQSPTNLLS
jgi:hypothetical protein